MRPHSLPQRNHNLPPYNFLPLLLIKTLFLMTDSPLYHLRWKRSTSKWSNFLKPSLQMKLLQKSSESLVNTDLHPFKPSPEVLSCIKSSRQEARHRKKKFLRKSILHQRIPTQSFSTSFTSSTSSELTYILPQICYIWSTFTRFVHDIFSNYRFCCFS